MSPAVYLDVDDEITTAVARIRGAPPGPVVLVVPWGSRLASSRINFRLLAREAAALQRELVVVTPEPATRSLAASAGLPTHATVLAFEAAMDEAPGEVSTAGPVVTGGVAAPSGAESPVPGGQPAAWSPSEPAAAGAGIRDGRPVRGGDAQPGVVGPTSPPRSPAGPAPGTWSGPAGQMRPAESSPSLPVVDRRPGMSRTRVAIALALIAALVLGGGAMAAVFLPSADITIQPASQPVGPVDLTVTADPTATMPDAGRLVVPATTLELPVSVKAQFQATGKQVLEEKAKGAVTFQNCDTGGAHTFPAGAQVRTAEGIAFVTAASVRLDRAKINPAFACTSANVNVTAVAAGPEANVVAGTITRLPSGFDPVVLSVVNRVATTGGTRTELLRVVQADVDSALAALRTQLADAFAAKLSEPGLAPAGSVIVGQTHRLGDTVPTPDPKGFVGREQASFELELSATGTVLAVNPGPASDLANSSVQAAVADGFRLVAGSTRVTVDPPAVSGGIVTFAIRARADQIREINVPALVGQIRGRSVAAARTVLEPYGAVRISVWPDWVTAIPSMDGRVRLIVAPAAATPGSSPSAPTRP